MVKLISRVNENQFGLLSFVAIIGLVASVIFPSPFINFTVLLIAIFALSSVMPTDYSNLRVVYAFTYLAIGFGLYLVLRGFLIAGPISKFDFAICITLLSALALAPKLLRMKNGSNDFKTLKFSFVTGSTTLVFCLAFGTYLMSKGIGYFLAWSGSGDSRNHVQTAFAIARKRVAQRSVLMAVVILLVFGALSGMLWIGGSDVINGRMTGGDLGAFIFYAILMATGVGALSEVYGELQRAVGASERLMELLHAESDIIVAPDASTDVSALAPTLELRNLTFCYPSRPDQPALSEFSLTIAEDKVLALVGPSGAGKSTLFDLVQRFYDPQHGEIYFGGVDIRQLCPSALRSQIAVVQQQPTLFTGDVMYNIRYGRADATDEQVFAAAKAAHADDFISRLPNGYHSDLGEQGVRLSGGQRQRIAIARALLKDPRILLLDEATSALDAESEYKVQLALEKLMKGRTTVIIAHRLATILHADQIVVLDHGRKVAEGSHQQLLKSSPLYARLAELQFSAESVEESEQ